MMTNLFMIFDPSTSNSLSLNWISNIIPLLIFPLSYWKIPSRMMMFMLTMMKIMSNEMKIILGTLKYNLVMMSLFLFIFINNIYGLYPYIFTSTSHLIMTFTMALPLWMSLILYGIMKKSMMMMAHLVPMGSPLILSFFMVIIETVSNLIRPLTLSIRLTANMISGHLLLSLLSSAMNNNEKMMMMMMPMLMILLMLETAVAIIQSYVFSMLMALYMSEIN
uniref:ATP synthase subunit a n=1 Tax=Nuttalliella namaqua TaxID=1029659 RepID=A0A1P8AGA8_9ACAR|nr:ATP synthase F0 subunit 6 [Nuttalliella namaqua]UYB78175.1 ATP synthase F0 subunit 6 [Nuttalliella namaqua]